MREVAKRAGVSIATVSRALSGSPLVTEATRRKVAQVAKDAGYAVNEAARNLRQKRARAVEVLIPVAEYGSTQLADPFFLSVIGGLADQLTARGYDMLLSTRAPWSGSVRSDAIASGRADGIIVIGQGRSRRGLLDLAGRHRRVVVWGEAVDGAAYPVIGSDNRAGGAMAARHLLALGRRDIVFFGEPGPPEIDARYAGYAEAMAEAGLPPRLVVPQTGRIDALSLKEGALGTAKMDAIVASTDAFAMAAIAALNEAGRQVPGDVAVVGYDGVPAGVSTTPPLSTISQSLDMGVEALTEAMMALIDGTPARSRLLPPELIVRQSCGAGLQEG